MLYRIRFYIEFIYSSIEVQAFHGFFLGNELRIARPWFIFEEHYTKQMAALFDFGISQEDPYSEHRLLEVTSGDRILTIASGGEVPLTLLCLTEDIQVTAVDFSPTQIRLCRLKLAAALAIPFPENGRFLGFTTMERSERLRWYDTTVCPALSEDDRAFWELHRKELARGIIRSGRFERYIGYVRVLADCLIGRRNLQLLTACTSIDEQKHVFAERIASRASLKALFRIAFHPALYKKRGLDEQALIHADQTTGERFYGKFEAFCTNSPASGNYFLQFFLLGGCITEEAYPDYLKPENRVRLTENLQRFELKVTSFQAEINSIDKGFYQKIHLSNLGDWCSTEEFKALMEQLNQKADLGTQMCSRHLQKNQFQSDGGFGWRLDQELSTQAEQLDRFPFYGIQALRFESRVQTNE